MERLAGPHWLETAASSGRASARGYRHLYHYAADGKLMRAVTTGDWEVRTLHGVDEARGLGLLLAAPSGARSGTDVYRVKLDGARPRTA